eukprot:6181006-Pleurochrysis_carterae.AAC.1
MIAVNKLSRSCSSCTAQATGRVRLVSRITPGKFSRNNASDHWLPKRFSNVSGVRVLARAATCRVSAEFSASKRLLRVSARAATSRHSSPRQNDAPRAIMRQEIRILIESRCILRTPVSCANACNEDRGHFESSVVDYWASFSRP